MIQQAYKNNVQSVQGDITTTGFSIEVNESMFQMLTSNVYNDTKLAVMREWSTNACDACLAAGVEVKFDVHLPTLEEPKFFVRDYGTGLAPEDIVGLFSNLGASTKRNSDMYNGTLGIGRMAGLAVADAFTVESYYNGVLYTYVISMQNGVPVTMNLGNAPTLEPNGLKLTVMLSVEDIPSFDEKAEQLYKYFDYKPTLNKPHINIELDVSEHISDDWFIRKPTHALKNSNCVVMSQVAYDIPYSSELDHKGFQNLVIKAKPGAVTFNPGRESLSLNKATIKYLNEAFDRISLEYVTAANDALALCNNDLELMRTYANLVKACPDALIAQIDPTPFTSAEYQSLFSSRNTYYNQQATPSFKFINTDSNFFAATSNLLTVSHKSSYYAKSKPIDHNNIIGWKEFFYPDHVIVDLKSNYKAALNEHYKGKAMVTWQRKKGEDIDLAVEKAKQFLESMGIPYTLASSLVKDKTLELKEKAATREGFYASSIYGNEVRKATQRTDEEISNTAFVYVKLKNTTPILEDVSTTFDEYIHAFRLLSLIEPLPTLVGVAKKYQPYIEDKDNWVDFETYIKDRMAKAVFRKPAIEDVNALARRVITDDSVHKYPLSIQEFYHEIRSYQQFKQEKSCLKRQEDRETAEKFGAAFTDYEPEYNVDMEELENTYPLTLKMLTGTFFSYDITPDLCSHIAKLEEHYALHSSK